MFLCASRGAARLVHESDNTQKTTCSEASGNRRKPCETHHKDTDLKRVTRGIFPPVPTPSAAAKAMAGQAPDAGLRERRASLPEAGEIPTRPQSDAPRSGPGQALAFG